MEEHKGVKPRTKTLEMGVLNIKIHPHSKELYSNLFQKMFSIGEKVKIRGAEWGMPGIIWPWDVPHFLRGVFYRFLHINPDDPWLDTNARRVIPAEEGTELPRIPDHLRPNVKEVPFVFHPEWHRLFFDSRTITPITAAAFMQKLTTNKDLRTEFGPVDVIVESSQEVIQRILKIPHLSKLEIFITMPNPDDNSGEREKVLQRMEKLRARTFTTTYTSSADEGIKPDDETTSLMRIAASDGWVRAKGHDGELKIDESTDPHPFKEQLRYSGTEAEFWHSMMTLASRMYSKIKEQ